MDEKLEGDLYRENIQIAPITLRIGAYMLDMLIILLAISIMLSQPQKERLEAAQKIIFSFYSSTYKAMELKSTPDNSMLLENLRSTTKEAVDILFLYMVVLAGLQIIYSFIFTYFYGATLGQIILKIKVINVENFDKPKLHDCMKRAVLKYLLGTTFLFGFIPAFVDRFYRTLYDRLSKTIVVSN